MPGESFLGLGFASRFLWEVPSGWQTLWDHCRRPPHVSPPIMAVGVPLGTEGVTERHSFFSFF